MTASTFDLPFSGHFLLLAALAALCVGLAKSGISGIAIVAVLLMAEIFPARESTGVLLITLITGDLFAVILYRRHAQWWHIVRLLPCAIAGIVLGWLIMRHVPGGSFRALIGWLVLLMAVMQGWRLLRPLSLQRVPHTRLFQWIMGLFAGSTTMIANAAGPVMSVYLLAVGLPKMQFVGTAAWFFFIINLIKVPFSLQQGLITASSFTLNLLLIPFVAIGIFAGKRLLAWIPQKLFEILILTFAIFAAVRLILA